MVIIVLIHITMLLTLLSVVDVGEIESGYHRANPYHNAVHAADVTQAMNCYINEQKVCCCAVCLY